MLKWSSSTALQGTLPSLFQPFIYLIISGSRPGASGCQRPCRTGPYPCTKDMTLNSSIIQFYFIYNFLHLPCFLFNCLSGKVHLIQTSAHPLLPSSGAEASLSSFYQEAMRRLKPLIIEPLIENKVLFLELFFITFLMGSPVIWKEYKRWKRCFSSALISRRNRWLTLRYQSLFCKVRKAVGPVMKLQLTAGAQFSQRTTQLLQIIHKWTVRTKWSHCSSCTDNSTNPVISLIA